MDRKVLLSAVLPLRDEAGSVPGLHRELVEGLAVFEAFLRREEPVLVFFLVSRRHLVVDEELLDRAAGREFALIIGGAALFNLVFCLHPSALLEQAEIAAAALLS